MTTTSSPSPTADAAPTMMQAALLPSSLSSPLPTSVIVFLVLAAFVIAVSLFVRLVLPRIVSRVLSIAVVGGDISIGKIKLWAVEQVSVAFGVIAVEVERVSLQRNDFAANSYFTLKAEKAKVVRRSSEDATTPGPGGRGQSLGPANFEILVSKLLALLAVFSFVVEELTVEIELLSIGGRKKLLSVTRLGNVVLLSPSLTAPSLPPCPASPQPNYQPQPEAIAASQPQPSAKCLVKKLRQTFCLTSEVEAAKATLPDVDFNLPHTTHVDASVRDGVKIELSDGGFVALNSLDLLTALAAELGSSQQRRKRTDGLSSSERKVSSPLLLPSIKVITNMFCVRTFSAEMRLNMVSAWYHGANDATLSIRNIGSHSLVTGEQVFSVRSLRAEKLQDCAELTFEDLRGSLNGAVIVLFGKMEPYHENLDFELRIASGSARRRNEGTEVTLLQTRLYGLGDREIFATEAASAESAASLRFSHCIVRQCAVRPGQRDIELLLLSALHVKDKTSRWQNHFRPTGDHRRPQTSKMELALAVDVDNLVFDLPWKRSFGKSHHPPSTDIQFGFHKATLEFKSATDFSLVVKRWQAVTIETQEEPGSRSRSRFLLQSHKSILFARNDDAVKLLAKGKIQLCWFPFVHKMFYDCGEFVTNLRRKYLPRSPAAPPPAAAGGGGRVLRSFNVAVSDVFRLDIVMQRYTITMMTKSVGLNRDTSSWQLELPYSECGINGVPDIVKISQLNVCSSAADESTSGAAADARADFEEKCDATNKSLEVSLLSAEFAFPYQMNVHEAYSGELLCIVKWLKRLHGTGAGQNFRAIHPDILIFAKSVSFVVPDDPFEVRLRENFELLEDEFLEAEKRSKLIEEKIADLRRTHIMLPSAKVDELYANLKRKNADIYVKRSMNLKNGKMRTRLMELSFSAVEFFILSDSSLTGKQTMCDFMMEVEPDAVWPFDLDFSSMYFKWLRFECKSALVRLRDYPQPLIDMRHVLFWGKVCLAEQMPTPRAVRRQTLTMDRPDFEEVVVERSLYSFKVYQDIAMDMDYFVFSHGPCWEPVVSQVTLALNFLTGMKKSDPSPPLTWWDKLRYMNHGRLLLSVKTYKLFLHTSPDPYNTTEEIELNVSNAGFQLINNEFVKLDGSSLDVFCRTASKYDDCRLVHVPNFVASFAFDWLCNGNAKDHHSVALCAAENTPDYSSNLVHDSYRAFRCHNVNIRFNLETKSVRCAEPPKIHMFSSTIRWLESLKWLFAGTSRPIRRGKIFANLAPRKQGFFRHFKEVNVSFFFHQVALDYWSSASMEKGFLLSVAERGLSFSGKYSLRLVKTDDGLVRRPRSNWVGHYTNCEFGSTDVWFQSICKEEEREDGADENDEEDGNSISAFPKPPPSVASSGRGAGGARKIEKNFFLSVESIQYNREIGAAVLPCSSTQQSSRSQQQNSVSVSLTAAENEAMPSNCLVVNGARGAWTISNRDLAMALYESWRRAHLLRSQISENSDNILKPQMPQEEEEEVVATGAGAAAVTPTPAAILPASGSPNPSATSSVVGTVFGEDLSLNKLLGGANFDHLADLNNIPFSTVYSEDQQQHTQPDAQIVPEAKKACSKDDSLRRTWVLKFVNCQVLLKGSETEGYVILSSSKAEAIKTVHRPVWKDENLLSKSSWSGSLECMQYFATVAPNSENILRREEEILWLTRETIGDAGAAIVADVIPGAGDFGPSVGGVVCKGVLAQQLQRIVSNCTCEFYYVSYGDDSLDAVAGRIPKRPDSTNLWSANREEIVNCFSLVHHDLNVCTNSLQYSMILDVLNNLLLFVDPTQRSRTENYLRMKYQMMLSNEEDHRSTILQLQTQIRQLMCQLRDREKYEYSLRQARSSSSKLAFDLEGSLESLQGDLEDEIQAVKENVTAKSEELDLRMRCLLDLQTIQSQKGQMRYGDEKRGEELRQKSEIIFSRAQWRLTETDGQLGIADASIINFSYTKSIMMNESTDHLVEMGYLGVKNLLKEQLYADVILPTDLQNVPVDRQRMLRVFCRAKGKVGGISVHDHFEINLAPLTIGITQSFYKKIIAFCFPEKTAAEAEAASLTARDRKKSSSTSSSAAKKSSSFYVESPLCKDDVEQMKERAQLNKLFNYIKIPEVPICVSYKGEKEKSKILDVASFLLQLPTIEYHRVHWTWLDLLLAVKSRVRESLISQAIKQKLSLKNHSRLDLAKKKLSVAGGPAGGSSSQQEDDVEKAKLLFGDILLPTSKKK